MKKKNPNSPLLSTQIYISDTYFPQKYAYFDATLKSFYMIMIYILLDIVACTNYSQIINFIEFSSASSSDSLYVI